MGRWATDCCRLWSCSTQNIKHFCLTKTLAGGLQVCCFRPGHTSMPACLCRGKAERRPPGNPPPQTGRPYDPSFPLLGRTVSRTHPQSRVAVRCLSPATHGLGRLRSCSSECPAVCPYFRKRAPSSRRRLANKRPNPHLRGSRTRAGCHGNCITIVMCYFPR